MSDTTTVIVENETVSVIVADEVVSVTANDETGVVTVAEQGPPGIQGIPGPVGGAGFQVTAGEPLSSYRAARMSAGKVYYCDGNNPLHAGTCVGMTMTAALTNALVPVQALGEVTEPSWNYTDGGLFIGTNGQLSTAPGSAFVQEIARVMSPTKIFLNLQQAFVKV